MKKRNLLIVFISACSSLYGQYTYESPHVFEGKTLEITIPKGFYQVEDAAYLGGATYTREPNVLYDNIEEVGTGILEIAHEPLNGNDLEGFKAMIIEEFSLEEGMVAIEKPTIHSVKGKPILFAAFNDEMEGGYLSATEFGEYMIIVVYYAENEQIKNFSYENFKQVMGTWKLIETDKVDGFLEGEFESGYLNDYFETELSYFDILPDFEDDWNETEEQNEHLLSEFCYKENQGFVRVFSGGNSTSYTTPAAISKALNTVFDKSSISVNFVNKLENEDHIFSYYTISGGGDFIGLYTTEVDGELVFFVIDKGSQPATDFAAASKLFMQNMLVAGEE